jgi:hypothetical protein
MTAQRPGLRLHERTMIVQRYRGELGMLVWESEAARVLTDIELAGVLMELAGEPLRGALRQERHGRRDKKADEA